MNTSYVLRMPRMMPSVGSPYAMWMWLRLLLAQALRLDERPVHHVGAVDSQMHVLAQVAVDVFDLEFIFR